jgi:hypothetical protein
LSSKTGWMMGSVIILEKLHALYEPRTHQSFYTLPQYLTTWAKWADTISEILSNIY